MEFNTQNTPQPEIKTETKVEERVILSSSSVSNVEVLSNSVKVDTVDKSRDTITVTHDVTALTSSYTKDNIKSSLVNVYGSSGKLYSSPRNIESVDIPKSEYPIRLEYTFITQDATGIQSEYTTSYNVPLTTNTTLLSPTGASTSSNKEMSVSEAIKVLDDDMLKIKNNLQNFSFLYDNSQKKVVTLQSYLMNISSQLETITKELADVKQKVESV